MNLFFKRAVTFLFFTLVAVFGCPADPDDDRIVDALFFNGFPADIRNSILDNMEDFKRDLLLVEQEDERLFVVADKKNLLDKDYDPGTLVSLDDTGIKVNKKGMQLEETAFNALKKMLADARKAGLDIMVSSAYRSYRYQTGLYNYYISVYGKEETDKFSAPPGSSQHQLGTVVDFGSVDDSFYNTAEEKWLRENAGKYGFSLSFPKGYEELTGYSWECWHFRYVTPAGAAFQKKYFNDIQHYMLMFLQLVKQE